MSLSDESGTPYVREYEAPSSLEGFQNYMPRFGQPNNLTAIFESQSSSEAESYALGLIFTGCIILGFFLLWAIVLMVFMCIGHKVGFLSGAPFLRKPIDPTDGEGSDGGSVDYAAKAGTYRGDPWKSRPTMARICFILSGVICIAFGVLMVTYGITNLQSGINTANQNALALTELTANARVVITEGLLDVQDMAEYIRTIVVNEFEPTAFCPADPSMDGSETARDFLAQTTDVTDFLDDLDDFSASVLEDVDDAMRILNDGSTEVSDQAGDIKVNDWEALIVLVPYTIFPAIMIVAALLAFLDVGSERYHCFISWFVLPIFILMTIVACIFAAAMAMAAGVNGDFCLPGGREDSSPDQHIRDILTIEGYDQDSFVYKAANWYVSQCQGVPDPLLEIREYDPQLDDARQSLEDFIADVRQGERIEELSVYCNRDYDTLQITVEAMLGVVQTLRGSLERLLNLAQCGRLIPLYTSTLYDAGCSYSPKAVFWIFSGCLVLGFFGMLMITLRASMKMTLIESDYVGHFPPNETQDLQHQVGGYDGEEVDPDPYNMPEDVDVDVDYNPANEASMGQSVGGNSQYSGAHSHYSAANSHYSQSKQY